MAKRNTFALLRIAPLLFFTTLAHAADFMALLTMGLSWHYKEQPEEEREQYSLAETEARGKRVGLQSDAASVPPWEWRHRGKSAN